MQMATITDPVQSKSGYSNHAFQDQDPQSLQMENAFTNTTPMTEQTALEEKEILLTEADFEDLPADVSSSRVGQLIIQSQEAFSALLTKYSRIIKLALIIVSLLLFTAYFIWSHACRYTTEDDIRLTWLTVLAVLIVTWSYTGDYVMRILHSPLQSCKHFIDTWNKILTWILIGAALIFLVTMIIVLVITTDVYNLVSLTGILAIVFGGYITSFSPRHVNWRPVLVGLYLQFIFALLILRTNTGRGVFQFLGDRISEFLAHTDAGSKFVFGETTYMHHLFVFKVMPVIIFFSTFTSVMYYLGAMQAVIKKLAELMYWTMGTTAGESMNAAANIFLGQTEAPLTIRPIIGRMTNSELHAVITGGFATVAGGVFAAYMQFGVPANHLLAASVMSAPAALAMSKLFYPETKKSKTKLRDLDNMLKSPCDNIVDAAATGAVQAIGLVASIVATVLSFIAILHFMNATLTWFGERACMTEPLTFQMICSYLMWPMAFLMGVRVEDCRSIAELVGIKLFLNEFIAYEELGKLIKNRERMQLMNLTRSDLSWSGRDAFYRNGTQDIRFPGGILHGRSEIIATYALCGFANFGSMGIMVNGLSEMAPHRKGDISGIVIRALAAGTMACFLTACIAGLFADDL